MLQLVLGRTGTGKTEYVFSNIKKLVESGEDNILLITPEQYSFISERRLLNDLGEDKINCVENGSFSRLSNTLFKAYGGNTLPTLSKGAKAVVFKRACENIKDNLIIYNKNVGNVAFINSAINIYDEMKSCRVSSLDVMNASENTSKELLSQKLHDISLIMDSYDSLIEGEFFDCANELTRVYKRLLELDYFVGKTVFIDGFNGFVAQEYKILEVIIKQAKMVYLTFCTDSYTNFDKYDLYSYVNSNINYLKDAVDNAGSEMLEPIILDKNYRYNSSELNYVERYAYSNINETFKDDIKNIELYAAKSVSDECDYVASSISKLLRNNVKASKIAVVCRDLDKYQKQLQYSFSKFGIPYFNDDRQQINCQPLIMFVNFLLRVAIYSFRTDDIFSMIKTGLTALDDIAINKLENYVFLWGINGSKWKSEFTKSTKGLVESISDNDKAELDEINVAREYIIDRLTKFTFSVKKKSAQDICKSIYYTLLDFSVDKGVTNLAKDLDKNGKSALAYEQGRIWDLLMDILNELATVGGGSEISIKEFYKLFNLMILNEDLGSVPAGLDNVQFGSADRIRFDNPYAVFVIGANEGEFPQSVTSSGLLTESDRVALIDNQFKLYSYGETLNSQEKYFAYMSTCAATDKLYVSYQGNNNESIIVTGIKSVFPNLKIREKANELSIDDLETNDNAFEILASSFNENTEFIATLKEYFFDKKEYKNRFNAVDRIIKNEEVRINDKELAKKLFKNDIYLSASKIEQYYNCAFRYFCKFGIGAAPRAKAELDPMKTGTVIHYVLECLIKEIGSKELVDLSDNELKNAVDKYLTDYLENKMGDSATFTPRFKYQFMRLSKMIFCVVDRLKEEFSNSDFEARAFELEIGNGDNGESVKSKAIILPDGGSIQIKGSIDRVDTYTKDGTQYVRVVDYKSGTKDFHLSDIIYGLNLQMFVYLFSLCSSDNELSGTEAGVLYMHSGRKVYSANRDKIDDSIKKENSSAYKMKGIVLNDDDHQIAEHMEHDLKGEYIPVKVSSRNGISGNIVSLEDMGRMSKKINELIVEMGVNLHEGNIIQNPVDGVGHNNTCDICDYADVCKNRISVNFRSIESISHDEVLKMLKEDENA